MEFKNEDYLNYDDLEIMVNSIQPNKKAMIMSNKLKNYMLIHNENLYIINDNITYAKYEGNYQKYLLQKITLLNELSFENLANKDQKLISKEKGFVSVFENSAVLKYLPQLEIYLTKRDLKFDLYFC